LEKAKKAWIEAARQSGKPIPLPRRNEGDVHKIISWGKCNRVKSSDVINFSDFFSMFHLCSCNIRFFSCPFLVHRIQLSDVYVK
jgi:hypothetical protein